MRNKYLTTRITFLILFLFANRTFAQNTICGNVYCNSFSNAVANIKVFVNDGAIQTQTNERGYFEIKNLQDGAYKLLFAGTGYTTLAKTVNVANKQKLILSLAVTEKLGNTVSVEVRAKDSLNIRSGTELISKTDLMLRPVNTTQDMLRSVPGLFIAQHAGGGKAEQLFLRGFDVDHGTDFAIYVDGMPVNMVSHAHGQGYADLHFVIPETVNELKVFKGPYYAQSGDFATSGTGAFETSNFLARNLVKVEAGQFNTFRGLLMLNLLSDSTHLFSKRKESLYMASEYYYSNGYFTNPANFRRFNSFLKYYGQLSKSTVMSLSLSGFTSSWNASGQIPVRAVEEGVIGKFGSIDPSEGGQTTRLNANIMLDTRTGDHSRITNQVYYSRYDFSLFSDFAFFLNDPTHGDEINQIDHRNVLGYKGAYETLGNLAGLPIKSRIGLEERYDEGMLGLIHAQKRNLLDTFVYGKLKQSNTAAYIDENWLISTRFRINGALRYDLFNFQFYNQLNPALSGNVTKGIASPKLSFFYTPNRNMEIYVKTGMGFHSNDARAVILNQVENLNKDVLPRATGAEIGSVFKLGKHMLVNTNVWVLALQNELVYSGDEGNVEAIGRTLRKGIDLSARYEVVKYLYLDLDLNYNHGRLLDVMENADRIPLAPVLTSIGGISYKKDKGFGGSLRYRYMSDRPADESNTLVAKGYFIMDAIVNYTQNRYQIGISVENLLNTYWREAQFATTSRLKTEASPVTEIHYTPGTPFFLKGHVSWYF